MSQKISFGPAYFIFDNPAEIFPTSFLKKSVCSSKKLEMCMFWKTFFFSKVFLRTRRMQFEKIGQKSRQEAENICSVSENDKKFHLFPKTIYFSKIVSIDTEKAVLTGRPNFYCSNTRNDPKKVNKRCKNFSKIFSSKCSYGEVESSLKAPLNFFRQPAEFFRLIFKK